MKVLFSLSTSTSHPHLGHYADINGITNTHNKYFYLILHKANNYLFIHIAGRTPFAEVILE